MVVYGVPACISDTILVVVGVGIFDARMLIHMLVSYPEQDVLGGEETSSYSGDAAPPLVNRPHSTPRKLLH